MVSLFGDEIVSRNEDIANGVVSFHSFICMEVTVLPASFLLSLGARKIMGAVFTVFAGVPRRHVLIPIEVSARPASGIQEKMIIYSKASGPTHS